MNSLSIFQRNDQGADQQQDSIRAKNLAEIMTYAPDLRFFGEVAVTFIIYFQLLYIRLAYEFPTAVTIVPTMLYTCYWIWNNVNLCRAATDLEQRAKHVQTLVNWVALALYQVLQQRGSHQIQALLMIKLSVSGMAAMYINLSFAVCIVFKFFYFAGLCERPFAYTAIVHHSIAMLQVNYVLKGCVVALSVSVSLRSDKLVSWKWTAVLWYKEMAQQPIRPYWVIFVFSAFISIAIIFIMFHSGYKFVKGNIDTVECNSWGMRLCLVLFTLWLFYTIVGLTFGSLAFVVNELRYLSDNSLGHSQALIIPLFYLPIFCVITFFLYYKLRNLQVGPPNSVDKRQLPSKPACPALQCPFVPPTLPASSTVPSSLFSLYPPSVALSQRRFSNTYFQRISSGTRTEKNNYEAANTTNMRLTVGEHMNETLEAREISTEGDSACGQEGKNSRSQKVRRRSRSGRSRSWM